MTHRRVTRIQLAAVQQWRRIGDIMYNAGALSGVEFGRGPNAPENFSIFELKVARFGAFLVYF